MVLRTQSERSVCNTAILRTGLLPVVLLACSAQCSHAMVEYREADVPSAVCDSPSMTSTDSQVEEEDVSALSQTLFKVAIGEKKVGLLSGQRQVARPLIVETSESQEMVDSDYAGEEFEGFTEGINMMQEESDVSVSKSAVTDLDDEDADTLSQIEAVEGEELNIGDDEQQMDMSSPSAVLENEIVGADSMQQDVFQSDVVGPPVEAVLPSSQERDMLNDEAILLDQLEDQPPEQDGVAWNEETASLDQLGDQEPQQDVDDEAEEQIHEESDLNVDASGETDMENVVIKDDSFSVLAQSQAGDVTATNDVVVQESSPGPEDASANQVENDSELASPADLGVPQYVSDQSMDDLGLQMKSQIVPEPQTAKEQDFVTVTESSGEGTARTDDQGSSKSGGPQYSTSDSALIFCVILILSVVACTCSRVWRGRAAPEVDQQAILAQIYEQANEARIKRGGILEFVDKI